MKYFTVELRLDEPVEEARRRLLSEWTSELAENGYSLTSQSELAVTYEREYRQWLVICLAIFFFPLGLLFLLIKSQAAISAMLDGDSGETVLTIKGQGPRYMRKHFKRLPERISFSERKPQAPVSASAAAARFAGLTVSDHQPGREQ